MAEDLRSSGCYEVVVFDDRPAAALATEVARVRLQVEPRIMRTPLWVGDHTLALVLHHRPGAKAANERAGIVTLLDGTDLTQICRWMG